MVMEIPNSEYGENGALIFADCALNPDPTAEEVAEIAIAAADSARVLAEMEPRIAMLSYSTMGSGKGPNVDKMKEATAIAKAKAPELLLDGELQADAALVPSVAAKKCKDSAVAGKANVLIFPDLNAGNIAYKLVQRLAKAEAIGPISQGVALPVNDLSRGCSAEDVANVVAITAIQAQMIHKQ
jgi:phosphate acetyltransferase